MSPNVIIDALQDFHGHWESMQQQTPEIPRDLAHVFQAQSFSAAETSSAALLIQRLSGIIGPIPMK